MSDREKAPEHLVRALQEWLDLRRSDAIAALEALATPPVEPAAEPVALSCPKCRRRIPYVEWTTPPVDTAAMEKRAGDANPLPAFDPGIPGRPTPKDSPLVTPADVSTGHTEAQAESAAPAPEPLTDILRELVACKDYMDLTGRGMSLDDYNRRWPLAWEAARAALTSNEGDAADALGDQAHE
jgi:hypothetical protein